MKSTHISWLLTNLYLFVLDAYVSPFGAPPACSNTWRCSSEPPACCIAGVDLGLSSARCQTAGFVAQGLPSRCTSSSMLGRGGERCCCKRSDSLLLAGPTLFLAGGQGGCSPPPKGQQLGTGLVPSSKRGERDLAELCVSCVDDRRAFPIAWKPYDL